MSQERKLLGEMFIEAGKIEAKQLEEALMYKRDHRVYLGKALIKLKMVTEEEVLDALSAQLLIPSVDPLSYNILPETLKLVKEKTASRLNIIPLFHLENTLTVACADQNDVQIIDELSKETVLDINLVLATERSIEQAIELQYSVEKYETEEGTTGQPPKIRVISKEIAVDVEIIQAVNMMLEAAIKMGASDIHVDPREDDVRIRFRVDGVLQQYYTVPRTSLAPIISRIKILSGMDIAETRRSQDGRFRHEEEKSVVDIRCASFITPFGEKMVMRILDASRGQIALQKLGFSKKMYKQWEEVIQGPYGLILVSGPTGSGKSTTLYSTLNVINSVEINVLTIEDPIEYQLENINQSQVNEKAGVTFSSALRSMLRLDPDVIMVGEMRDVETVELAIRAALTGHIVFSTIHTNDASSSYTRILNMGVDAFLISSTVRAILAQRLVRQLCTKCKEKIELTTDIATNLDIADDEKVKLYKPVGCLHCKSSGYVGRSGVYELLIPNEEIITLVNKHAPAHEIEHAAKRNGMLTLRESARQYVLEGKTSIDEMYRITIS
ncbi:MAG: ATPase, T2SS/T4P/T4SS family [Candidatus Neomarinimicrobiota bacterium]